MNNNRKMLNNKEKELIKKCVLCRRVELQGSTDKKSANYDKEEAKEWKQLVKISKKLEKWIIN